MHINLAIACFVHEASEDQLLEMRIDHHNQLLFRLINKLFPIMGTSLLHRTTLRNRHIPIQHSSLAHGDVLTTSGGSTPTFRHSTSATLTVFIYNVNCTTEQCYNFSQHETIGDTSAIGNPIWVQKCIMCTCTCTCLIMVIVLFDRKYQTS